MALALPSVRHQNKYRPLQVSQGLATACLKHLGRGLQAGEQRGSPLVGSQLWYPGDGHSSSHLPSLPAALTAGAGGGLQPARCLPPPVPSTAQLHCGPGAAGLGQHGGGTVGGTTQGGSACRHSSPLPSSPSCHGVSLQLPEAAVCATVHLLSLLLLHLQPRHTVQVEPGSGCGSFESFRWSLPR